ncbi:MAG: cupin domain-containing protein [Deltaproteobacteria bacterium]|nr:cupin domain-containing protein [Deltaproteobacteria bacterium]
MEKRSWDLISKEKLSEAISRQMIWGKNLMAVRIELAPNSGVPIHEHESEQLTMVQTGQVTLHFPEHGDFILGPNEMLVIPSMVPHSALAGPEGCQVIDLFSPIRQDFIDGSTSYFKKPESGTEQVELDNAAKTSRKDPYTELHGFLAGVGIRVPIEKLREYPLDTIARYTYEKECITMGQLRQILGIDKKQAKDMLRIWKHGDDHSESSYKRNLERVVIVPNVYQPARPVPDPESETAKEKDGRKEDSED